MKRDEDGNIKLYDRKNRETGTWDKVGVLSYVEDVKTGNMYLDESYEALVVKCALVAFAMPFYTFGEMSWHLCKTPLEATLIALDTLAKVGGQLAFCHFYEGAIEILHGFSQVTETIGSGIFEIVKAPIFGLGVELAALYGVAKPFHGRKFEALIENAWKKGASYKDDFRNIPARPNESCWQAFVQDIKGSHPFYLAHCFQVRENVNDPRIIVIRRESL